MAKSDSNMTPMMRQYFDAKKVYPDALLLFRMGDFYEMFYDDAKTAARVLNLALTSRDKGPDATPMAGFPYHQLESYLGKLITAGFRAAVCEQTEDPKKAIGLVKREIIRVVTPGTLTDDALLDPRESNWLAAVAPKEKLAKNEPNTSLLGVAWVDLSTGRFLAGAFPESRIVDELARIAPSEILLADDGFNRSSTKRLPSHEIEQAVHEAEQQAGRGESGSGIKLPAHLVEKMMVTRRPDWAFSDITAHDTLTQHFGAASLEGYGFGTSAEDRQAIRAAGALVDYLRETQKTSISHIDRLVPYRVSGTLEMDESSRRSLEITKTLRDGRRDGSLLATLDQTITAMGSRLLADRVANPSTDRCEIERRQDAIAELLAEPRHSADLREILRRVYDIERLLARVTTGRASPRDLGFLAKTLQVLPDLTAILAAFQGHSLNALEQRIDLCDDLYGLLSRSIVDDAPLSPRDGGFIRLGFSEELDALRELARGGKQWIAAYQAQESERTGIPNLKVGFNKVFGYYLEILNSHKDKIPAEYIRKQTVKNAERYITPALKEYEEKVLSADERSTQLEYDLFLKVREAVLVGRRRMQQTAAILAEIDVFLSFAELARSRHYCRPKMVEEPILKIVEGRHPVLDAILPTGTFVPNDLEVCGMDPLLAKKQGETTSANRNISLETTSTHSNSVEFPASQQAVTSLQSGPVKSQHLELVNSSPMATVQNAESDCQNVSKSDTPGQILLITGPNMAGKSTYIRQVALLTLMAQIGSYIPAKEAVVGIADRIFARVGASDELSRGQSTFMVEMMETARILNTATQRSLVILDEIGRGTSTYDGISLAWAVVEQLHKRIGARTLFATHYHELTSLTDSLPRVKNRNVAIREWNDEVVFLHRIIPGAADKSYGIYVARLAGVPREVITRAETILAQLEAEHIAAFEMTTETLNTADVLGPVSSDVTVMADTVRPSKSDSTWRNHTPQERSRKTASGVEISERSVSVAPNRRPFQLTFFELSEDPILEELDTLDLNSLAPLDALNLLNRWKQSRPQKKTPKRR